MIFFFFMLSAHGRDGNELIKWNTIKEGKGVVLNIIIIMTGQVFSSGRMKYSEYLI